MTVKGRVALVTGAGSGIGEEAVKQLAVSGCKIVVNDIDEEKISKVVDAINGEGGEAIGICCDVSKKNEVQTMMEETIANFGKIDILINNAGISKDSGLLKLKEEDWDKVIDINLKGTFLCSQQAVKYMREQKYGRIINISSRAWLGWPGQSNYSASKGGVVSLTRTMALELAKHKITCNCIAPGIIKTPLFETLSQEQVEKLTKIQPTKSIGVPADIAYGILFFAADDSDYITGQVIFIGGGKSLLSSLSV